MFAGLLLLVTGAMGALFTGYDRQKLFDDRVCDSGSHSPLFTLQMSSKSVLSTHCLSQCKQRPTCISIFVDTATKRCIGHDKILTEHNTCSYSAGARYYTQATANYGDACTSGVRCIGGFTTCFDGQCRCKPGYSYLARDAACVADCRLEGGLSNGTTYQFYHEWRIYEANIRQFITTLENCKTTCTDDDRCHGIDWVWAPNGISGKCQTNSESPRTNPSLYDYHPLYDYYHKDCA